MKEYVVRVKEIYIVDIIVEAEDKEGAIKAVLQGEGNRGDYFEKNGYLHPRLWEILEL